MSTQNGEIIKQIKLNYTAVANELIFLAS